MSKRVRNILSLLVACAIFFVIIWLTSGAPENASLADKINPVAFVEGVVFTFEWGFGLSAFMAIFLTILITCLIITSLFIAFRTVLGYFFK